jgi:hypothetical protein
MDLSMSAALPLNMSGLFCAMDGVLRAVEFAMLESTRPHLAVRAAPGVVAADS